MLRVNTIFFLFLSLWVFPLYVFAVEPVGPKPMGRDTVVRLQIYLDQNNFGPGKIDGRLGNFTRLAVRHYNYAHNIALNNWQPLLEKSKEELPALYRAYRVQKSNFSFVSPGLPYKPEEQQYLKYMSYRSILEFIAERFHTDIRFLRQLNKVKNLRRIRPGSIVLVPNVPPFKIEEVKKHQSFIEEEDLSLHSAVVDTKVKNVTIYDYDGKLIAAFPITPGKEKFIHYGQWKILNMVTTPVFRYDKQMLQQGKRSKEYFNVPAGPNNPVGILWAGLNKTGIGLHGTNSPETIGRSRSAGCIRLANWDAIRLPFFLRPNSPVLIR